MTWKESREANEKESKETWQSDVATATSRYKYLKETEISSQVLQLWGPQAIMCRSPALSHKCASRVWRPKAGRKTYNTLQHKTESVHIPNAGSAANRNNAECFPVTLNLGEWPPPSYPEVYKERNPFNVSYVTRVALGANVMVWCNPFKASFELWP